jgi:hypothetical protein
MGQEQQYVELGELAARRLREQLDHLADAVRLHHRSAARFRPSKLAPLLDALHQENADLAREGPNGSHLSDLHSYYERPNLLHSILYLIRNASNIRPRR